jgi:hypothetical protein
MLGNGIKNDIDRILQSRLIVIRCKSKYLTKCKILETLVIASLRLAPYPSLREAMPTETPGATQ